MLVKTKKTWQEVKDKLDPHIEKMDGVAETKALDAFLDERDAQLAFSKKDREWEKDRKKEWAGNKKTYFKKLEEKKSDPLKKIINEFKDGGWYNGELYPYNHYILVKVLQIPKQLDSGIYLPDAPDKMPNVCEVIRSGPGFYTSEGKFVESWVKEGHKAIFRKGAGMEVRMKGKDYLFLTLDDFISEIRD